MCTLGSKKRVCLSAESGTGDDSVILTPTRAEISEPPKVESVITISNENGAARVEGGGGDTLLLASSVCASTSQSSHVWRGVVATEYFCLRRADMCASASDASDVSDVETICDDARATILSETQPDTGRSMHTRSTCARDF